MIDNPELLAFLLREEQRAIDTTLDGERAVAISFYNGELFGDEEEGRSQIVTRDVAEVIDYAVISVLRPFVSGDKTVEFEAKSSADTQHAEDATRVVLHYLMQEQDGERVLHDMIKAGLLEKTGAAKVVVSQGAAREQVVDVTYDQLLEMDEPLAAEPLDEMGMAYRVTVMQPGAFEFAVDAVPNEELRVSPEARNLESALYIGHIVPKQLSDFITDGLSEEELEQLWSDAPASTSIANARDSGRGKRDDDAGASGMARRVWMREEYILYDLNGDGHSERLMVRRVGNNILSAEEVEEQPFFEWCPYPMQHRRVGQSLADKVMSIQRVRSLLMRQLMDNLYLSNAPRTYVDTSNLDPNTIDDLITTAGIAGAIVRHKGAAPTEQATPMVAGPAMQALELWAGERESLTGITRLNQGLDADGISKTATGTALMQNRGEQQEEYWARNFSAAFGKGMRKFYRLLRQYGQAVEIKIDGQFRKIDPSAWPEDIGMAIRVGLGSGNKDERLQARMLVEQFQEKAMVAGLSNVTPKEVFNNFKGWIADAGLGNASDYFQDPDTMGEQPERADPAMAKAQSEALISAQRLEGEQAQAEARLQIMAAESAAKRRLAEEEAAHRQRLDSERALFEASLARDRMALEADLARMKVANEASISSYRPGGDLAQ